MSRDKADGSDRSDGRFEESTARELVGLVHRPSINQREIETDRNFCSSEVELREKAAFIQSPFVLI